MARSLPFVPLVICAAMIALLSRPPPRLADDRPELVLPRKEVIRVAAAPMLPLAVDFLWIQLLFRIGTAESARDGHDIYRYARLISELEPGFRPVYMFGAVMTVWEGEDGSVANARESAELLRTGLEHFPDHLQLYVLLAYNLMTYQKDNLAAAEVLARAARLRHAQPWLGELAVKLYRKERAEGAATALMSALAEQSRREGNAAVQLRLDCETRGTVLSTLNAAILSFKAAEGRGPRAIEELLQRGHLRAPPPPDPFGGRWIIGAGGMADVAEAQESCL